MRGDAFGARGGSGQLGGKRNLALVAQHAELTVEIFRIDAESRLPAEVDAAGPVHGRDFRKFRHSESKSAWCRRPHSKSVTTLFGFAQSNVQRLRPPVAPHGELDGAASGDFMDHAAELRRAFDALAIHFRARKCPE